ncbi:MAG TPA: ABC transporter ATP-binding protein [Alphaproteobacteria bacterium]|nr:ABC transporter ATP-binding protein [Alphaproteobacteria bacterium]
MRDGVKARGAAVRLQGLQKAYGEVWAVRDVSLAAHPGEFVTFLGPSGSGKTTTLMMIAGFVAPTRGEIYIDDRPVARVPPESRGLGMVFQSYALFPHMTVAENIAFPLRMRRRSRHEIAEKLGRALEVVRLPGYESRYPRQLSGGQQQRVALARAIVFEPRVLLMDEPLGSLDKKLREQMQAEIKRIQRELDMTVIYVTHDQEEALTMSDRIVVMQSGTVQQIDTPMVLYDRPANQFVADFIGESNFLAGTVVDLDANDTAEVQHASGRRFRAAASKGVARGMSVVASIRPERLAITGDVSVAGDNCWEGRVVEIIFVGDAVKCRIAMTDEVLTVKTQNREIASRIAIGDEVTVTWRADHAAVLPARPSD